MATGKYCYGVVLTGGLHKETEKTVYQTVYHGCLFTSDARTPNLMKLLDSMTDQMPSRRNLLFPGHPSTGNSLFNPLVL